MATQPAKTFPKPVDWDELYPGRFIKAGEFKGKKPTLTITDVKIDELVGDKGPQIKGVISFKETEKQWALNKTNGICLKELFGRKVQEWVGKRVTLFAATWDGEECIRVWGAPHLTEDRDVTVSLPRKRPFSMTMHKGSAGPRPVTTGTPGASTGEPASDADNIATLRAAKSLDEFTRSKKSIWSVYEAAGREVPLDVEDAANMHREQLEGELQ